MTRISFIAIGNELLKGRIVNTNAAEAALLLRQHGYDLNRMLVVGDEASAIAEAVTAELEQQQVVLLSGGLGPTRDDLTKKTLADLFGSRLQLHAPSLQHLKARFAQRKRMLTPRNQQQAYLPHNCEPIPNAKGTAPGMLFKKGKKMLFAMPGVPFELRYMLEHEVIPRIRQVYTPTFIEHRIVRLSHIPESHAADRMAEIEATFDPHLSLAYLPRNDGLWLELSVKVEKGRKDQVLTALNTATARIKAHFTDYVYAEGSDPLEVLVGRFLRQKSLTLAVAESLTGGKIAAKIVSVSGASHYFNGSVTAYQPAVKTSLLGVKAEDIAAHTVVSEPVARQMAEGVRKLLGADIGLATTGIAEAQAGEQTGAWLAYSDVRGSYAHWATLLYDRNVNIERAANYALILCWKKIQQHFE